MNPTDENKMIETLATDTVVLQPHPVRQVTKLSKYLALSLFIGLPFLGAFVGYQFAPVEQVITTISVPVTNTKIVAEKINSEKTPVSVLMSPMLDTQQIKFSKRTESEGFTRITFAPNDEFEKDNGEIIFKGSLEFLPSAFSGSWVGMFTPSKETLSYLPTGEPEGLPEYFYIVDPDTVAVLCESFDCKNYTEDNVYKEEIYFSPQTVDYETYNRGFDSYPKTLTFEKFVINSPTN